MTTTVKNNVKKWIAALRSGKYRQVQGRLYNGHGGYCCLGVACRVDGAKFKYLDMAYEVDGSADVLAEDRRSAFGLSGDDETSLINMNDDDKLPFLVIADWIETNILKAKRTQK